MKISSTEKALLRAVERGEWKPAGIGPRERSRYERHAKATTRTNRGLTINLSTSDFEALQKRALAAGVPCGALVAIALHKYATGACETTWRLARAQCQSRSQKQT